jgi:hypothetical protein
MMARDFQGSRWYVVTVHYPTGFMAKRAWERAERKLLGGKDDGVGVTRLAPNNLAPNPIRTGAPPDKHPVTVVTRDLERAQAAERLLRDGEAWEPVPDFADALIARRARVIAQHEGETGTLIIRRPDKRGAFLDGRGVVREQPPGRG